jgi:hypothetical protein
MASFAERKRFDGQDQAIIKLLKESEFVTNKQLSGISLTYKTRLSEIRKLLEKTGETVVCIFEDRETGEAHYALRPLNNTVTNVTVRVEVKGHGTFDVVIPVENATSQRQLMQRARAQAATIKVLRNVA